VSQFPRAAIELTGDQDRALAAFTDWLTGEQPDVPFVLSGYAGSGKTFLSMRLLRQVEASGLCWTVVAPTHKAVGVLRQALSLEGLQPTWYPSTIHRLLRLKLRRQGDRELCESTEQTAMALEHLGLVLIDEASMVDSSLLTIALQCAHPFRTRLVFVGDPAQLPPVGEAESPVFALQRARSACLTQGGAPSGAGAAAGQWPARWSDRLRAASPVSALAHAPGVCGRPGTPDLAGARPGGVEAGVDQR